MPALVRHKRGRGGKAKAEPGTRRSRMTVTPNPTAIPVEGAIIDNLGGPLMPTTQLTSEQRMWVNNGYDATQTRNPDGTLPYTG